MKRNGISYSSGAKSRTQRHRGRSMGRKTGPLEVVRVVLGSVPDELGPEREAVERALSRLRESAFSGLEWVLFDNDEGTGTSQFERSQGQVYIGLLAGQGSTIDFEPQYRGAKEHGLHSLVYI